MPDKILLFGDFFSEWRQVKSLAITSAYLENYNNFVFNHFYLRKPYQICSGSSDSKGKLLTHNTSSHIDFLNCPPTFWNFNLIHALSWAYNYYNGYMPIITLLIKTYPEGLKLIELKLKNFVSSYLRKNRLAATQKKNRQKTTFRRKYQSW